MALLLKEASVKLLAIKSMTLIYMQPVQMEEMEYTYGAMLPMTMTLLAIWFTTLSQLPPISVGKTMAFIIHRQVVISAITSSIMLEQVGVFTVGMLVQG